MRERPILFSGPMVRAILDGRKTQTRRVVYGISPLNKYEGIIVGTVPQERANLGKHNWADHETGESINALCPYGEAGDRLWVRETFASRVFDEHETPTLAKRKHYTMYRANGGDPADPMNWHNFGGRWKPAIHMPRWASRLTLGITAVRVERLQAITEDDSKAEGCDALVVDGVVECGRRKSVYRDLWDKLNAKRGFGWATNPWVWVLEFRPLTRTETGT